ncbi:protein of unknown function [Taphrina deformans PYCC 5710]|uniref:Uncharacterized protein n=1 Tax=Taphrina deformans (strain PYCC 5710 / ATCC 11124 / CBS 356.35 / IMI 108563 / JCM 9778 / NBRC 8474) TaxID=1097556 RepID=R4XCV5_TAPDE|nr:protein of unknown function [Taphrina deformans PYCC 5710]|eukprot:CCG82243.1 protein of unknown function [Taphrina deformans PYCC 5710]
MSPVAAVLTPNTPSFIIRDLDKDPHGPAPPSKNFLGANLKGLATPDSTPNSSPRAIFDGQESTMTRSGSDLSTYTTDMEDHHQRNSSMVSSRSATFPFTSIFKWKRTISSSSVPTTGLQSPPIEDHASRTSGYFNPDVRPATTTTLDNLGLAIKNSKNDFNSVVEAQLQEERRLRHLAEDRLTEVEEEVTRLCTVLLPTDTGEAGEAYFSSILSSVRTAINSYEERTDGLERQLEEKSARLTVERRERINIDIEHNALRAELKQLQIQVAEASKPSELLDRNEELARENESLRDQLRMLKEAAALTTLKAETAAKEEEKKAEIEDDRAALLQRVKDTEAQRDALREVSRGLRQRLTIETRKNADKMRALAAIDTNITTRHARSHSRQSSSCLSQYDSPKLGGREYALSSLGESLVVPGRPKPERFVTAMEVPSVGIPV